MVTRRQESVGLSWFVIDARERRERKMPWALTSCRQRLAWTATTAAVRSPYSSYKVNAGRNRVCVAETDNEEWKCSTRKWQVACVQQRSQGAFLQRTATSYAHPFLPCQPDETRHDGARLPPDVACWRARDNSTLKECKIRRSIVSSGGVDVSLFKTVGRRSRNI